MDSTLELVLSLPEPDRTAWIATLTEAQRAALHERLFDWRARARPAQLPPESWAPGGATPIWVILTGRAWGKTLTGGNTVRAEVEAGRAGHIALIERTPADARDTMIEGPTGIMAESPPWFRPTYEPAKRRLVWPNGAQGTIFTASEPDQVRGGNFDLLWAEELAAWKAPETWANAMLALRFGAHPRAIVTSSPKPTALVRRIVKDPAVFLTRGSTYENRANLPASFLRTVVNPLEGSRLGRQEIHGEILDESPGALWKREWLEAYRVTAAPELRRIVVGVDPTVADADDPDAEIAECGIVVAGLGYDGHGYMLADLSLRASPLEWARTATRGRATWKGEKVVAEDNNGGEMVRLTIHAVDRTCPVKKVRASRSKEARAEPVSALSETSRIHHVGYFPKLEDQLCGWEPGSGESPDRLDAYVWAFTELMVSAGVSISDLYGHEARQ